MNSALNFIPLLTNMTHLGKTNQCYHVSSPIEVSMPISSQVNAPNLQNWVAGLGGQGLVLRVVTALL